LVEAKFMPIKFNGYKKMSESQENMADQVILLVAGLCNLKNDYVVQ